MAHNASFATKTCYNRFCGLKSDIPWNQVTDLLFLFSRLDCGHIFGGYCLRDYFRSALKKKIDTHTRCPYLKGSGGWKGQMKLIGVPTNSDERNVVSKALLENGYNLLTGGKIGSQLRFYSYACPICRQSQSSVPQFSLNLDEALLRTRLLLDLGLHSSERHEDTFSNLRECARFFDGLFAEL